MYRARTLVRVQLGVLVGIALLTVIPIKLGAGPFFGDPSLTADVYFYASLISIFVFQYLYMAPLSRFRIRSWRAFLFGIAMVVALVSLWFNEVDGRLLDFSDLSQGGIFSPLVFAASITVFQFVANIIGTETARDRVEKAKELP